jgi:peptide/nickel transport system permease protein
VLVFAATQALPGNAAVLRLAHNQNPEALFALRRTLHLDEPAVSQYWLWVKGVAGGNLGNSLISGAPVSTLIAGRVTNTLVLAAFAALIGFPLGLAAGIITAVRRDSMLDHVLALVLLGLAAVPDFVLGIALILLLGTGGFNVLPAVSALSTSEPVLAQLDLLVLPALTLALVAVPYIARMVRASLIEVLESDYIAMARLKGLSESRVILRHALVNGSGPAIQAAGVTLAYLAGGVVVVEAVFGYPGLGSALVSAVQNRDIPVIQTVSLLFAACYVLINIMADAAVVLVTPKLRTSIR